VQELSRDHDLPFMELPWPRSVTDSSRLVRLVQTHSPSVVFLSETRQNKNVVESICRRLGFQNCLPVSVKGKGGGLALF
jgi:hypothetical protein